MPAFLLRSHIRCDPQHLRGSEDERDPKWHRAVKDCSADSFVALPVGLLLGESEVGIQPGLGSPGLRETQPVFRESQSEGDTALSLGSPRQTAPSGMVPVGIHLVPSLKVAALVGLGRTSSRAS